jgi:hypothetical protein
MNFLTLKFSTLLQKKVVLQTVACQTSSLFQRLTVVVVVGIIIVPAFLLIASENSCQKTSLLSLLFYFFFFFFLGCRAVMESTLYHTTREL